VRDLCEGFDRAKEFATANPFCLHFPHQWSRPDPRGTMQAELAVETAEIERLRMLTEGPPSGVVFPTQWLEAGVKAYTADGRTCFFLNLSSI